MRAVIPSPQELLQLVQLVQRVVPARLDPRILGSFAGIVHTDSFTVTNNDVEMGYLLKQPLESPIALSDEYVLRMRTLPAVNTMAVAVQTGGPDLVFVALGQIAQWIGVNGYQIASPYREIGIELPTSGTFDDMVIEVQIPIERMPGSSDRLRDSRE